MAKLSDLQASLLLQEIACAMRIGVPVDQTLRRLEARRVGSVGRVAGTIADGIEQGLSVSAALRAVDPTGQATAAVEACEQGGDPALLDRLALQLQRRDQIRSESRLGWFYPWVLLLIGYLVAVWVLAPLVRRYSSKGFAWPQWVVETAHWLESSWWIPPAIAALVLTPLIVWFGRRRRYSRPTRLSLFCSALADQLAHNRPEEESIRLAAGFSGDPSMQAISQPTLLSPEIIQVVDGGDQWRQVVAKNDLVAMISALRYRALLYEETARRHDYFWMRLMPRTFMILIGGGLILSYVWWVIAPVYQQVATW